MEAQGNKEWSPRGNRDVQQTLRRLVGYDVADVMCGLHVLSEIAICMGFSFYVVGAVTGEG